MKRINRKRKVVLPNFLGVGRHLYEDELGWPLYVKKRQVQWFQEKSSETKSKMSA